MSINKPLFFKAFNGIVIRIDKNSDSRNVQLFKNVRIDDCQMKPPKS